MANKEASRIFSENLKRLLEERNMPQLELAKAIGTGAATVNDWIKGRSMPRSVALQKIASVFGCEMADLLQDDGLPEPVDQDAMIKAAFFGRYARDLSSEEMDDLWDDARDYLAYKIAQRKKRKE